MKRSTELTMRDLARIAGVDQSTVSRALSRQSCIASATRRKILRLAEQHGYVPNPLVSACMRFRRRARETAHAQTTLAYLNNYPPGSPRWESMRLLNYTGALHQAERRGYRLEPFLVQPGASTKRLCQILQTRNIRGVIVAPLDERERGDTPLDFAWEHFCSVAIGLSLKEPPLHHVAHNYYHGMRLALRECRKRGARRSGFAISDFTNQRIQGFWLAAYLLEQQLYELPERVAPFIVKETAIDSEALLRWAAGERLDSILCVPFNMEAGTWPEFIARLPASAEWINLDAKDPAGNETGIYQNHEKIGAAAVDLLISLLELNQPGPLANAETLLIEGSWVEGMRAGPRRSPLPLDYCEKSALRT